jgi:hypothetical protein
VFFLNRKLYIIISFVFLFHFSSLPVFANSYDYFSPVEVGDNPKRAPPQTVNNAENKDPTVYSNDIDQSPVTCGYDNQVTETVEPNFNIIDLIKVYIGTTVNSLSETKTNNSFTNKVFRDSQLQYAKDPNIDLDATQEDDNNSFKNYDETGRNTTVRVQPYKYELINKGLFIEDAVLSLAQSKNTVVLDEPIAWNCQGQCQNLTDENGKQPSNCTPITISEIAYFYYKNSQSTSYKFENNQAINIPFPDDVIKVLDNYQTYRSQFSSFVSDSCYQTLYKNMPIVPRGTINTKYVFYNNDNGVLVPTPAYRAIPLAASLASNQTSATLDLILPENQDNEVNSDRICQNFKPSSPVSDKPSPLSLFAYIKAFIKNIITPETITQPVKTDLVLPQTLVENLDKDSKFLDNFITADDHHENNFKQTQLASVDQSSNANIPDVGYKNSIEREYFAHSIVPQSWQTKTGLDIIVGPAPEGSTLDPNVHQWCSYILKYSNQNGISPDIIAALIDVESHGNPNAYSSQGAVGLMQIMASDGISAVLFPDLFKNRPTVAQLSNPEFNIEYGTNLLRKYSEYWGGLREGLFHYGPTGIGYGYADIIIELSESNKNYCQ